MFVFPLLIGIVFYGFLAWALYVAVSSLAKISRSAEEATGLLRQIAERQGGPANPPAQ
jgi:hypothetical protein